MENIGDAANKGFHIVTITGSLFTLISGIVLLCSPTGEVAFRMMLMEVPKLALAGFLIVFGALSSWYLLSGLFGWKQDKVNKATKGITKPYLNIQINSKDFRYMDSSQIKNFFRGVKQSFAEYGKVVKGVQEHEQKDVEKQPNTKARAKEAKSKR